MRDKNMVSQYLELTFEMATWLFLVLFTDSETSAQYSSAHLCTVFAFTLEGKGEGWWAAALNLKEKQARIYSLF